MPLSETKRRWLAAHPDLGRHQSMKRRHDHHDYQSPCIYMITLAIKGRRPLLGAVYNPISSGCRRRCFISSPDVLKSRQTYH